MLQFNQSYFYEFIHQFLFSFSTFSLAISFYLNVFSFDCNRFLDLQHCALWLWLCTVFTIFSIVIYYYNFGEGFYAQRHIFTITNILGGNWRENIFHLPKKTQATLLIVHEIGIQNVERKKKKWLKSWWSMEKCAKYFLSNENHNKNCGIWMHRKIVKNEEFYRKKALRTCVCAWENIAFVQLKKKCIFFVATRFECTIEKKKESSLICKS